MMEGGINLYDYFLKALYCQPLQQFIILKYFQRMDSEPVERCDNCLKDFPESKMATHFGYCRRNIKKCPICQEMFDINFKQDHEEEFHKKEKCLHCSKEFSIADYKDHQKKCDLKPKFCEYCELNVPVATYSTHYAACESRTKPCTKCSKPIMNKDYLIHSISCDGVVAVQPKKPASYQQSMLQNQKKIQEVATKNTVERISSMEKPIGNRPKQQNIKYAEIPNKREEVRVYEPRIISQPRQQLSRKEYINYPPQTKPEVKRQEAPVQRYYAGSLNAVNVPKKQETKSIGIKPPVSSYEQVRRSNGSRQAPRPPVSNKDIFPEPSVKDSKYLDKNGGMIKRQEEGVIKNSVPTNIRPQQIKRQGIDSRSRAPVVPKPKEQIIRRKSPEVKNEYMNHNELGQFSLSPEEQMMQEILMQSVKEQKYKSSVAPTQKKTAPKNETEDTPYLDGEDIMSQSFIDKQKAIMEELSQKNKGKR